MCKTLGVATDPKSTTQVQALKASISEEVNKKIPLPVTCSGAIALSKFKYIKTNLNLDEYLMHVS